jgi:hypothetical protein
MLIDNKSSGKVGEKLKETIASGDRLSFVCAAFSLHAFEALKQELTKSDSLRLLLAPAGVTGDVANVLPIQLTGDAFETRLRNRLTQAHIARECAKWLKQKATVRQVKQAGMVGNNLFHIQHPDHSGFAVNGSSQFTTSGLGYSESPGFHMNMGVADNENTRALLGWFDTLWNSNAVEDAKQALLHQLQTLYRDCSPQFIYFLTLYNLFKDFIEDIDEEKIIRSKTGVKDTAVWNKLYRFQRDGVIGAIDKLERYNGCIIADSVGLGKTFEALAIIKYYELRNDRVLVLCPKKLRENWTLYTVNDKRNLLVADRFNYDVLNHTDLTREDGFSGEINLETLNWGNYDLVVIDESHNFRNNNPRKDGKTRYSQMMQAIIRAGVKTKVLMLSATPVNNRMNDLKNQVAFITEGRDDALADMGLVSIEQTLRKAQSRFNAWVKQNPEQRSAKSLLDSLNFDYFKLLDLLTIARSRKHIEKYYGTADIGKFPQRLKPRNIKADIDSNSQFPPLHAINRTIRRLHLGAYSPLKYVRADKREEYSRKYDQAVKGGQGGVFRQADREESLIHLMRVNLLKRMESSIHSFHLTVNSLLRQVDALLEKVEQHQTSEIEELSIENIDFDSPEAETLLIGNKVKVLIQDMDLLKWKQDLQEDRYQLQHLLEESQAIGAERDAKLHELQQLIRDKAANPINPSNRKAIIFTAFADTAMYLYQQLAPWVLAELGLHSALVTGAGSNKTTLKGINTDLGSLLMHFSPLSKERDKIIAGEIPHIDLLIATDCISEGQNLQDCDTLINYDIHWNPVRIIQRFGRIDRLGSKNTRIQLVNFWPNMALDEYINLEARVSGRMVLLDISATGEENIIVQDEASQMNDLEYRRKQLEQLQETVLDLEDLAGGVSITDLTLNDFRMDLAAYMKAYPNTLEQSPSGLLAVASLDANLQQEGLEPGVIFCLKNIRNPVQTDNSYALAPHFLVYVTAEGEVKHPFTATRQVLDSLKKLAVRHSVPDEAAIVAFNRTTRKGSEMQPYQQLLAKAIDNIAGKSQETGVLSLFSRGGTVLAPGESQGIEDFEVVSYLVLQ